jgi:hypothetical protein
MRQMICGLTLFGLGSLCGSALALDPSIRELADDDLLRSYWHCDRQARLSAEAEERFAALHRWTEQNRAAAHSSLEQRGRVPPDNPAPAAVRVRRFI